MLTSKLPYENQPFGTPFLLSKRCFKQAKTPNFRAFSRFEKNSEEISGKGLTFVARDGTLCVTSSRTHGRAKEKRTVCGGIARYTIK